MQSLRQRYLSYYPDSFFSEAIPHQKAFLLSLEHFRSPYTHFHWHHWLTGKSIHTLFSQIPFTSPNWEQSWQTLDSRWQAWCGHTKFGALACSLWEVWGGEIRSCKNHQRRSSPSLLILSLTNTQMFGLSSILCGFVGFLFSVHTLCSQHFTQTRALRNQKNRAESGV